jgi:hypothetical protein
VWTNAPGFEKDVFTFARLRYNSWRSAGNWRIDWPDADFNLSFRLQQLTSLKGSPEGKVIDITDSRAMADTLQRREGDRRLVAVDGVLQVAHLTVQAVRQALGQHRAPKEDPHGQREEHRNDGEHVIPERDHEVTRVTARG